MRILPASTLSWLAIWALSAPGAPAQSVSGGSIALADLKPGQQGEVWTVFQGTVPEPFAVEVTGIVRNALGPGKSLILCQLTDPRVQQMGAVAGMSGSPLYIGGKFAGALSYGVQAFEKVPYAGFTPAADLAEVGSQIDRVPGAAGSSFASADSGPQGFTALRPVFTLSGLSPQVATMMQPYFRSLGLSTTSLGGSSDSAAAPAAGASPAPLRPGDAVSVALATGDITLAGTGTVSTVDGNRVVAFGHPMMSLGNIELPMCSAEIVTIIPSALESIKVANTGPVIGTITQDRLSAVSGTIGRGPDLIPVEITVNSAGAAPRTIRFQVARQQQLTPAIIAAGVTQAIVGSNDTGLSNGFRLNSDVTFSASQTLASRTLFAGPQAFTEGLNNFIKGLTQDLQNPYEKTFPQRVAFSVESLAANPAVTVDQFQLSRSSARPGETVEAELAWRDYQGDSHVETFSIPIDPSWAGKTLEVVLAPGRALDELTGRPRLIAAAQLRSLDSFLAAVRDDRPNDGLCLAVVEASSLFTDEAASTPDLPASLARIANAADEARFQQRPALLPLWEHHLLDGKLVNVVVRRSLRIAD